MFEVPYGQDPYNTIGKYIRDHINIIEDVIAVIEIDGVETNQLFMVDMDEDGFFIWKSDWYEGEEKVVLMDFFPVSEAINSSSQPGLQMSDPIDRQAVIDAIKRSRFLVDAMEKVIKLPPSQPEPQWIPCSERLPENDDSVLITHSQGVTKAWWNGRFWANGMTKKFKTVTAWMPLPEPYRGEQK